MERRRKPITAILSMASLCLGCGAYVLTKSWLFLAFGVIMSSLLTIINLQK